MAANTKQEIEAVLFASGRFLEVTHIAEILESSPSAVRKFAEQLRKEYEQREGSLQIIKEEDAYKLHVRDEFLDVVSRIIADTEVSGPVMETLAVISWRSPVLQSEVVETRGSNAYDHIKELLERGFVTREPEGRSYRLRITEKFFEYFDVEGRDDIKEVFKEVEEAHRKKEMELELRAKRIEKDQEQEESQDEKQKVLETGKASIDELESVLEKSRKARKEMAGDLAEHTKKPQQEEEDSDLASAQKMREQVEEDIEELSK